MAKKKNKNLCSKSIVKHSPPTGKKCMTVKRQTGVEIDSAGQGAEAGLFTNSKLPSKKNLTLKSGKTSLPTPKFSSVCGTDVKNTKSAKDSGTSPSEKKQIYKHKSSVQSLLASVGASSSDESGSEVTYMNNFSTSKKKVTKKVNRQETTKKAKKAPNIDGPKAFHTIVSPSDDSSLKTGCVPIYDIGVSNDKYVNTVLHKNCATKFSQCHEKHCKVFNLWKSQSK